MRKAQSRESRMVFRDCLTTEMRLKMKSPIIQFVLFSLVFFFSFKTDVHAQFGNSELSVNSLNNTNITRPRISSNATETSHTPEKNLSVRGLEQVAFKLANEQRITQGLPPVIWDDDVVRLARLHSENMAKNNFFSHKGLDGLMVSNRADLFGISRWRAIGENIAYNRGYENPAEFTVECWMKSASHRENLLDNRWKESAIGVAVSADGSFYFTQVFLLRK